MDFKTYLIIGVAFAISSYISIVSPALKKLEDKKLPRDFDFVLFDCIFTCIWYTASIIFWPLVFIGMPRNSDDLCDKIYGDLD